MRIIRGIWKGRRINPPKNLPVRPTTDIAKEALFNVLENSYDFEELKILDLFAGTGSISYEFASRGAQKVTAIEQNSRCIEFINKTKEALQIKSLQAIRYDVFLFAAKTAEKFDLIFADPPYDCDELATLPNLIFENDLLNEDGVFVLEHPIEYDFESHSNFFQHRKYGKVNFSFFKK
ncbi:MAG: 16S rRNA (guanine(966)-N(2))-methyltransferase RsmD [Bacteroidales bacterium]|jgi:16S rRNA (guanine(966)-N(2))-methyltransferase RsmD|nr:16S rRNA (guanine(966)-N(2))-methyltransferase RsmD [Bacteroidales bacterium]